MARFDYSYRQWEKEKPDLLPSTGLGKALKAYEAAVSKIATINARSDTEILKQFGLARATLADVETARTKAIKTAGRTFPGTRKLLESAIPVEQEGIIEREVLNLVRDNIDRASGILDDKIDSFKERIKVAKADLKSVKNKEKCDKKEYQRITKLYTSEGDSKIPSPKSDIGPLVASMSENSSLRTKLPLVGKLLLDIQGKLKKYQDLAVDYRKLADEIADTVTG